MACNSTDVLVYSSVWQSGTAWLGSLLTLKSSCRLDAFLFEAQDPYPSSCLLLAEFVPWDCPIEVSVALLAVDLGPLSVPRDDPQDITRWPCSSSTFKPATECQILPVLPISVFLFSDHQEETLLLKGSSDKPGLPRIISL